MSDAAVADTRRLNSKPQDLTDAYGPPSNFLEIDIFNPQTVGVGRARFTTYEVRMRVTLPTHVPAGGDNRQELRSREVAVVPRPDCLSAIVLPGTWPHCGHSSKILLSKERWEAAGRGPGLLGGRGSGIELKGTCLGFLSGNKASLGVWCFSGTWPNRSAMLGV
ncbi:sorting nexin-12 isoform X2 [Petaurus breviceps papuanus]|uniref:sorting nexin-12 isoform X2 n=1 Tax=Petaurus breviceps papuanus TaxID=3040969 RepID=UPI0036DE93B4